MLLRIKAKHDHLLRSSSSSPFLHPRDTRPTPSRRVAGGGMTSMDDSVMTHRLPVTEPFVTVQAPCGFDHRLSGRKPFCLEGLAAASLARFHTFVVLCASPSLSLSMSSVPVSIPTVSISILVCLCVMSLFHAYHARSHSSSNVG